jgi:PPOX class probable F420-dependent enzyme
VSRRDQIQMTDAEIRAFLDAPRTAVLCSIGRDGVPHPMPMWYAIDEEGAVVMTTFKKSQKVRNLERDPRVSLVVDDGESYPELRGVVVYGRVELLPRTDDVVAILERITRVRGGAAAGGAPPAAVREGLRRTAPKRVGLRVRPERTVSWDHRKLGGAY